MPIIQYNTILKFTIGEEGRRQKKELIVIFFIFLFCYFRLSLLVGIEVYLSACDVFTCDNHT